MTTILNVNDLTKDYQGQKVVNQVSFHIQSGEAYGLLGPNGAGKSTIIHMVAGLLKANNGEVWIGEYSISKHRKKAQQLIGVVPQEIALYPSMSAEANLRFFGKLYGLKGKELDQTVENNLRLVGLYDRRKEEIDKYSGGMKRRINIAAALLHQPKLLIMDEPTVGIDPQSRTHILDTVKKLKDEYEMSILYTSHYMEEIEAICDRIGIIDHGQLMTEGTIAELKKRHGNTSQLVIELKDPLKIKEKITDLNKHLDHKVEDIKNGLVVLTDTPNQTLPTIMNLLQRFDCEVRTINIQEPNLETVFLSLTGRSLRDE